MKLTHKFNKEDLHSLCFLGIWPMCYSHHFCFPMQTQCHHHCSSQIIFLPASVKPSSLHSSYFKSLCLPVIPPCRLIRAAHLLPPPHANHSVCHPSLHLYQGGLLAFISITAWILFCFDGPWESNHLNWILYISKSYSILPNDLFLLKRLVSVILEASCAILKCLWTIWIWSYFEIPVVIRL